MVKNFDEFSVVEWISYIALYPFMLIQLWLYSFFFAIEVTKNAIFGEQSHTTIMNSEEMKNDEYQNMKQLVEKIEKGENNEKTN